MESEIKNPAKDLIPQRTLTEEIKQSFINEILRRDKELAKVALNIDSLGPWSYSKKKSLHKCPFQFYLKYVLKFKVPEDLQYQSDPLSAPVGKAAHSILENILLGKKVDKAYEATRKEFISGGILTQTEWENRVDILHYNISNFQERIEEFGRTTPIRRVFTELRMGVTRNYEATDFFHDSVWLRGVIDLILMLECMDIIILDHKTGGGQGSVDTYKDQLDWYKILFHFGISKIQGAQTGVHFIGEGVLKMADYTSSEDIESKLVNVLEMTLEGAIEMLLEKGYFKHVRGNYCKWCEYDAIGCKSGELKPLELSTKRWIQIHNDPSLETKLINLAPVPATT